jgi:hypothetical protein
MEAPEGSKTTPEINRESAGCASSTADGAWLIAALPSSTGTGVEQCPSTALQEKNGSKNPAITRITLDLIPSFCPEAFFRPTKMIRQGLRWKHPTFNEIFFRQESSVQI